MNSKSNLQIALNKAFENHEEPLNEAQWTRLEGEITKRKKRRFFPFLFLLSVIGITAVSTYFLTLNYGLKNNAVSALSAKQNTNTEANSNSDLFAVSPQASHENPESLILHPENSSSNPEVSSSNPSQLNKNYHAPKTIGSVPDKSTGINNPSFPDKSNEIVNGPEKNNPAEGVENPLKEDKFEKPEVPETNKEVLTVEILKEKDTVYITQPDKKEVDVINRPPSRFAFSIAGGYSKMNVRVSGLESPEKLHKDTRKIFEQSNQNLKTQFINLGLDWTVLPRFRFGISTGIQYLHIATPVNINYALTEVPFWDSRHTQIDGYVTKDPKDAIQFNTNNTNYTTYLSIPVKLNYSIPLNTRNEILMTGGLNFSTLVSARGQNIAINKELNLEPGIKPLNKDHYRRFNPGLIGGIQYTTMFRNGWWFGVENLWQANSTKYKTGYGSVKNKLQGFSLNFIIKYKI